jgi:hypothetical protein
VLHRKVILLRPVLPKDFSRNNLLSADIPGHRSWRFDLSDDQVQDTEDLSYSTDCAPFCDGCDGDFLFDSGGPKKRDLDCIKKIKVRLRLRHFQRDRNNYQPIYLTSDAPASRLPRRKPRTDQRQFLQFEHSTVDTDGL